MPTDLENLKTRRTAIYTELSELDATRAGGKPNAGGSGNTIDHVGYKRSLYDELDRINAQIAAAEGPWEVTS